MAEHPALVEWRQRRRASGAPFRPDFQMYTGHGSPQTTADRLELLQHLGADSILLAWDLPSQLGFDPDHRLSRAQVGRAGVSCSSLADMQEICSKIDVTKLRSLGTLANSLGHVGFGMLYETLRLQNAPEVPIYMQNDPLKEFTARGTEIFDPRSALRIACDVVEFAILHETPGHSITVCSNHYDIAGAGPVVALGLALANGVAYMDDLVARDVEPRRAAKALSFFVNERSDFFIGAALFRCTRVLWADILAERYGIAQSEIEPLFIMGYAHGLEAPEEPLVNVARVAVSVLGAAFGGADTLCAAAYDEALRIPSNDAAALALRTIQVATTEHGVGDSVDPLNGSFKYESLCAEVYELALNEYREIQSRGGAITCIENGYSLSRLTPGQEHRHEQLVSGQRPWIGVNQFSNPELRFLFRGSSQGDPLLREVENQLISRAIEHKNRYRSTSESALVEVEKVASSDTNLVEATVSALRAGATSEQIVSATRKGIESMPTRSKS